MSKYKEYVVLTGDDECFVSVVRDKGKAIDLAIKAAKDGYINPKVYELKFIGVVTSSVQIKFEPSKYL